MTEKNTFSFSALQQKANDGDAQAQFDLAYCYIKVEKTFELAFNWLKKSAEQGLVSAQLSLGFYYFFRCADKKVNDLYYSYRDRRSPIGLVVDPMELAMSMKYLDDREEDISEVELAFEWFNKAAEQGADVAQYWVARCFYDGIGIEKNFESAFECVLFCSNHGENSLSTREAFKTAKIALPTIYEKSAPEVQAWVKTCYENPYSRLRRGVIEGCQYVKKLVDDKLYFNEYIKKNERVKPEDILNYLDVIENFLPLREPINKTALYKLFIRTLSHEWEAADTIRSDKNKKKAVRIAKR